VFEMSMAHMAKASKDRTGMFMGKPEFVPTVETGRMIAEWCSQGIEAPQLVTYEQVLQLIRSSPGIPELNKLYNTYPKYQQALRDEFTARKNQLFNTISGATR
jgi:hypothetical protein